MQKKIGIIIGSLRQHSYNRMVANTLIQHDQATDYEIIEIGGLPFFNQDLENDLPQAVVEFREKITEKDGIIFITPEYNSGISGVLKNALDWGSRPPRQAVLTNMPAGVIGATPGGMGTAFSQLQLRQILEAMRVHVVPFQKLLISKVSELVDPAAEIIADEEMIERIVAYAKSVCELSNETETATK